MSAVTANLQRRRVPDPLAPFVAALRLGLDDPRGASCAVDEQDGFVVLRPPDGSGAIAVWPMSQDDDLAAITGLIARTQPPIEFAIAHVSGPVPDETLRNPPKGDTRWVFAWRHAARTELTPWGGRLEPRLVELLQIERAEFALRHVREELEKHFGNPAQLYFTPDALTSSSLTPAMLANAVRLVVEDELRCRLLDVDGQAVAVRMPRSVPLPSFWGRLWMLLTRRHDAVTQLLSRVGALDEARLVLVVRSDRRMQQLDVLRQAEWKLTAEERAAHEAHGRADVVRRIAEVRREVRLLSTQLEIMGAQRQIVEDQLQSVDLRPAASGGRLASLAELTMQAAAARSFLTQVRDAAALVMAAEDAIAAETKHEPAPQRASSPESASPDIAPLSLPDATPRTPDPFELQAYEFLSERDEDEPDDGPPRTVHLG